MQRPSLCHMRSYHLVPFALLWLGACVGGSPTAPAAPSGPDGSTCGVISLRLVGARTITPLPQWSQYYARAEACAGRGGDFIRVRWFMVDRIEELDGTPSAAVAVSCADDIYLTDHFEPTVRHEILHHVLGQNGHPAEYFPRCAEDLTGSEL